MTGHNIGEKNTGQRENIGILLYYPFQYYVHKNIYRSLKQKGASVTFVIDPTAFFPVKPNQETLEKLKLLLKKENVDFVEFKYENFFSDQLKNDFLRKYSVFVSTWWAGLITSAREQKKVFVTYGAGKELTTFAFWKRFFDMCLAYGEYDHRFFSQLTASRIVGNPKFDDWFSNKLDDELIRSLKKTLDSNKKTVLYLPTHSDLSSLEELETELVKLTKDYNVIVKLHYITAADEPNAIKNLSNKNIILLGDETDLLPLLKVSDAVLSDNSSAIFDAFLADKPVLVTDFHTKEYLDEDHRNLRQYERGKASALTYSGSIEQRIKKDGTVITIKNRKDLEKMLQECLLDKDEIRKKRQTLTKALFKYQDADCGKRAADAIIELLKNEAVSEKPFLSYAVDYFELETLRKASPSFRKNNLADEENNIGDSIAKEKACYLIFDKNNNPDEVILTVNSLSSSKIRNYSIVTNSSNSISIRENLHESLKGDYSIEFHTEILGKAIYSISHKYEKVVFFMAGCILENPEYLKSNQHIFLRRDNYLTSGYVYKNKKDETSWDRLQELELKVSAGFNYYHQDLPFPRFFSIKNALWDNPTDESRFFIFDTSMINNNAIYIENLHDDYSIFLLIKNYYISRGIQTEFIPIRCLDTSSRQNFYMHKKIKRIEIEHLLKRNLFSTVRKQMRLIESVFSFPYVNLYLIFHACIAFLRVLFFYAYFSLSTNAKLEN